MNVNFKVVAIQKINKGEKVCEVAVLFDYEDKTQTFVRKYTIDENGYKNVIIDGCNIKFATTPDLKIISVERLYETKGKKRKSTKNLMKKEKSNIQVIDDNDFEFEEEKKEECTEDTTKEAKHEEYETLKTCIVNKIPIYLAGPAGSGKNFTLEQIANELNICFYFTNSVQQEYQLTGFVDAGGVYHDTQFYRACKQASEGIDTMFFLDEMDASIPEVLVKLNMAIAQGYFEFPNGEVLDFSENIHWVAAGNTVGSGSDECYTGRMVLDQASLDRFVIIEFNYSENIERKITNNNRDLIKFIHDLRQKVEETGVRATFSYRCMTMVTKLESSKMDLQKILKIAVLKGLDRDTINTLMLEDDSSTRYHREFKKMVA